MLRLLFLKLVEDHLSHQGIIRLLDDVTAVTSGVEGLVVRVEDEKGLREKDAVFVVVVGFDVGLRTRGEIRRVVVVVVVVVLDGGGLACRTVVEVVPSFEGVKVIRGPCGVDCKVFSCSTTSVLSVMEFVERLGLLATTRVVVVRTAFVDGPKLLVVKEEVFISFELSVAVFVCSPEVK